MKKLFILLMASFSSAIIHAQNIQSLQLSSSIPYQDVKMKSTVGNDVSIQDIKKQNGVLIMFSCNTCPYVIKNQKRTQEICSYAMQNNVGVIVINSNEAQRSNEDSYNAMKTYAAAQHYQWNYVVDEQSKLANAFGATRTPEVFLFDADGKLVYKGAIDDNPANAQEVKRQHLKEAMNEMNAHKNVTIKESRSVGCAIKRIG